MTTQRDATSAPEEMALDRVVAKSAVRARIDEGHVARLAEVLESCPPIEVSSDGSLIDGAHRLAAARLRGWTAIPAIRTAAPSRAAVLLAAARANALHGLPLDGNERRSAVTRLLDLDPELSDRAIAEACGVARATVASLRQQRESCSGGPERPLRRGRDNRLHPATPRRDTGTIADAIIRLDPTTTVRSLAAQLGVSVGTAHRYRSEVLARLRRERWWLRVIRRAIARWRLRRHAVKGHASR